MYSVYNYRTRRLLWFRNTFDLQCVVGGMSSFDDIDVLDLSQVIAGPLCTQLLGLHGAHVVKVEPPYGDAQRNIQDGVQFSCVNRGGKRSLSVDLKTEPGARLVRELASTADVVVESFRPGVLDQFDLDYESVAATNEDVIYCSITGFGQDGPRSTYPSFDSIIQAASGLMSMTGYPDRKPVRIGTTVIDYSTGANAAFAVSAGIRQRDRRGCGEHIDISLFDVAVSVLSNWFSYYDHFGRTPNRAGTSMEGLYPSDAFSAAGDLFYMTVPHDDIFERLCEAIDRDDLQADRRFQTNDERWAHREELYDELQSTFEAGERANIVETLTNAGVPAAPIQTVEQIAQNDAQAVVRELLVTVYNPEVDADLRVARRPYLMLNGTADDDTPPKLGEHSREVLASLGYTPREIRELIAEDVVRES